MSRCTHQCNGSTIDLTEIGLSKPIRCVLFLEISTLIDWFLFRALDRCSFIHRISNIDLCKWYWLIESVSALCFNSCQLPTTYIQFDVIRCFSLNYRLTFLKCSCHVTLLNCNSVFKLFDISSWINGFFVLTRFF